MEVSITIAWKIPWEFVTEEIMKSVYIRRSYNQKSNKPLF